MDQVDVDLEAADLLDRTADEIERRGHAKHLLEDEDGAVCLMGGLNVAEFGEAVDHDFVRKPDRQERVGDARRGAHRALFHYLGLRENAASVFSVEQRRTSALVNWNNDPEREPFEVVDACRHTAKVLRGG